MHLPRFPQTPPTRALLPHTDVRTGQERIPATDFQRHLIQSDGDCLFRSVYMGLNQPGVQASIQDVMALRQQVADYVGNNFQALASNPYFQGPQGVQSLSSLLLNPGQWNSNSDDLVAPLLAQVLGREIIILQSGQITIRDSKLLHQIILNFPQG